MMSKLWIHLATAALLMAAPAYPANWTPPKDLSTPGKDAVSPCTAAADTGTCTAVWSRYDGTHFAVQSAQARVGGSWSVPATLSVGSGHAFFPQVALDSQDNPVVVWAQNTSQGSVIQSSQLVRGGWSNPVNVSLPTPAGQQATKPQIAIADSGYTIAVWQKYNGVNNVIQAASRKNNRDWQQPENLTLALPGGVGDTDPKLAIDDHGNAIAVWVHTQDQTIQAATKQQNGRWSLPMTLSDAGASLTPPEVAYDNLGKAVVIWTRSDGTNRIVQSSNTTARGGWTSPVNLSAPGQDADKVKIALDSGGNAIAVWQRSDGVHTVIQTAAQRSSRGGAVWSPAVDLSDAAEDASDPQIYANDERMIAVVWKRSDGANFIIQATTMIPGKAWTPPVSISAPGQDATSPQVALDKHSNILVVWQRSDGQNTGVQATFGIYKK